MYVYLQLYQVTVAGAICMLCTRTYVKIAASLNLCNHQAPLLQYERALKG